MKYAEKYKALHEGAEYKIKDPKTGEIKIKKGNYGNGRGFLTVLKPLKKFIDEHPGAMVLDYGCGSAMAWDHKIAMYNGEKYTKPGKRVPDKYEAMTMTEYLGENLQGFYRYDPFHPKYYLRPPAIKFDLTVVNDVIEHVPLEEIPALLRDIADLTCTCGAILMSIPNSPSYAHFMDGENMHCTLMPRDEWKKLLRKYIPEHKLIINFTH